MQLQEAFALQDALQRDIAGAMPPARRVLRERVISALDRDDPLSHVVRDALAGALRPGGVAGALTPPMLGVAKAGPEQYRIAVRIERQAAGQSELLDRISREAKGEVDVKVVGRIRALGAPIAPMRDRRRPVVIGASVSHVRGGGGSVGCFVRREGATRIELLSNNHVLADSNRGRAGDAIVQPSREDGGVPASDAIGSLSHFVLLQSDQSNTVDAALATLDDGVEADPVTLPDGKALAGVMTPSAQAELLDLDVFKMGRTTSMTSGRVSVINMQPRAWYGRQRLSFAGQIEIESLDDRPFSAQGDSGSLVFAPRDATSCEAVGLLFAGSAAQGLSYATPMPVVLATLKATLAL